MALECRANNPMKATLSRWALQSVRFIFGLSTLFAPVGVLDLHRSLVLIRPAILVDDHR
jgi:hypothetical protein